MIINCADAKAVYDRIQKSVENYNFDGVYPNPNAVAPASKGARVFEPLPEGVIASVRELMKFVILKSDDDLSDGDIPVAKSIVSSKETRQAIINNETLTRDSLYGLALFVEAVKPLINPELMEHCADLFDEFAMKFKYALV